MPAEGGGAAFALKRVWVNDKGWGPTPDNEPEQFKFLPYSPFNKSDRLGKAAELSQSNMYRTMRDQRRRVQDESSKLVNESLRYEYNRAEDKSFRMVDSSTGKKKVKSRFGPYFKNPYQRRPQQRNLRDIKAIGGPGDKARMRAAGNRKQDRFRGRGGQRGRMENRKASVNVEPDWNLLEEIDLPALTKLNVGTLPEVEDLDWFGALDQYNDFYDKVTARHEKPLKPFDKILPYFVNTMDDPNIERYAAEDFAGQIFATDAVLAHLMTCSRSVLPWDLVVHKVDSPQFPDGLLFLYARDDELAIKTMTVNETANEMPQVPDSEDDVDHPNNLALEATAINQNFSQQILKRPTPQDSTDARKTYNDHPFFNPEEDEGFEPASVAYRYRRFTLAPYRLVVRTELHGYLQRKGKDEEYVTAYALNEWQTQEWRQRIDTMKGSILATELKNNSFKLAKWAAQSILAGADVMKIGFVSRVSRSSNIDHLILGTQTFKPAEFAERMLALRANNMWGIIKWLADRFLAGEEPIESGKYVLVKDPNKSVMRIYAVPVDAFSGDEEGEGGDSEDGAGEGEGEEDGDGDDEDDTSALLGPQRVFTAGPGQDAAGGGAAAT